MGPNYYFYEVVQVGSKWQLNARGMRVATFKSIYWALKARNAHTTDAAR